MRTVRGSILFGLLVVAGGEIRAQEAALYVPVFDVYAEHVSYPNSPFFQEGWRYWTSQCSVFNSGEEAVEVSAVRVFGPEGEYSYPQPKTILLQPGVSRRISIPAPTSSWLGTVQFALVRVPTSTVVAADVERRLMISRSCGPGVGGQGDSSDLGEGRAPLPVFDAPFPAGTRVMAGPVDLGSPLTQLDCTSGRRQYGQRRVNVTLFNAGDAETLFVIRAFRMGTSPDDVGPLLERSITVGAKRVLQVNDVPLLAAIEESGAAWHDQELVWITVEAPQPFLTYVSSVFLDPEPATLPFQVFAPHRIQ